jgi:hypothetical protein
MRVENASRENLTLGAEGATVALDGAGWSRPCENNRNPMQREEAIQMSYAKNGLRAFGLCLVAALGLMAFSAAGAQATTGWLVGGNFITGNTAIHASAHTEAVLSMTLFGEPVQILCTTLETEEGTLTSGTVEGLIKLKYKNCRTLINGPVSAPCKPVEPIEAQAKFHAILHGTPSLTYLLFEPDLSGGAFAHIKFNKPCVLFPEVEVEGSFVAECLNESLETMNAEALHRDLCLTDLVHHLIQEAPNQSLFGDGLFVNGQPAHLGGITNALVTNPAGATWAVHI